MKDGCILWGNTGSGKTYTALFYYLKHHQDKDLYVITTAKKRDDLDWYKEAASLAIGREVSVAGLIHVDSWNNIQKYKEIKNAFFIFDEQRLVGSGAWSKSFIQIAQSNPWILLSATPGDTWLDYIPVFIANGFYRNRSEFKQAHVVYTHHARFPKVERYLGEHKLERLKRSIVVPMRSPKGAERVEKTVRVDYDRDLFKSVLKTRWDVFKEEPCVDIAHVFRVLRKIVGTHPSRVKEVEQIVEKHRKVIIFYNFNYELELLRNMSVGDRTISEWNGSKHEPLPDGDDWVYLVHYAAGSEGWNCITANTVVFYSLTYSYKNFEQAKGRIDRLNTPFKELYYYILKSESPLDAVIFKSLLKKENFNERKYASSL